MKDFVIRVRRPWMLLLLPILALLYFVAVLVVAANNYDVGVPQDLLVWVGVGLFALVILVEVPYFFQRGPRAPKAASAEAVAEAEPVAEAMPYAPPAYVAPIESSAQWDDERLTTTEVQQGLTVIEWSQPAKSRHRNAVFTKAYVPVTKQHVLRVETLAAEGSEL
jgi:hypothetical protein